MHRRRLLSAAGIAVAGLLAGCSSTDEPGTDGEPDATETGESSDTDAPTGSSEITATTRATSGTGTATTGPTPAATTADEPTTATASTATASTATTAEPSATDSSRTTEASVSVPDPRSTPEAGGASVTFEDGGSRVIVSGTIVGRDGCRRAVLDSTRSDGGSLVVSVSTERDAGTDTMCTQALTPVEYRFTLDPAEPPDSVTVVHDTTDGRRTVATADRDA